MTDATPTVDASSIDLATVALPLKARMPRGALTMAWWAICSAMFYLFLGATLALHYGTRNALLGMLFAVVVFGLINGVLARYASRTGLSCSALSQAMFGTAGGALATLLLSMTGLYYAVFEGSVLAVTMSKVVPGLTYGAAAIVIALYSVPLVFGSMQHWLNRFNAVLLPFYLLGLALLVGITVARHGASSAWLEVGPGAASPAGGWWPCATAYFGIFVLSMCTVDFARFGRPEDAEFHAGFNFGVPFYFMTFVVNGAVGILLVGTADPASLTETTVVDASLAILGSGAGLAWVWITQSRSNSANYFLATVNLQAFIDEVFHRRVPKFACAVAIGIVVLVLTQSTNVFTYLITALNYQGVLATAWVGVALSYVWDRGDAQPGTGDVAPRRGGIGAWVGGAAAGAAAIQFGGEVASWSVPAALSVAALLHRALRAPAASRPGTDAGSRSP